ncbi:unnamed protein product [marine sediment metagenome]|uniref:Uncharacterized protein n=1 Tax=marine sediment metagenome TaxID=412755 RepID=X1W104_9ZZZZ
MSPSSSAWPIELVMLISQIMVKKQKEQEDKAKIRINKKKKK